MAPNVGDVIETTVLHDNTITGDQINRYQWEITGVAPVDNAALLDDVAIIIQTIYNLVKSLIAVRNVFREVRVVNITQDLLVGSTDAGTYVGGISVGDDAPQGVASFVYFTTDVPRVILSKYLPSPSVDDVGANGGQLVSGLTTLASYVGALMNPHVFGSTSYIYGYHSPKVDDFVVPQVGTASDIFAYQRRRKKGRGA